MTEKRFTLEENSLWYRVRDNGRIIKVPYVVDLLNEQDTEIKKLKQKLKN